MPSRTSLRGRSMRNSAKTELRRQEILTAAARMFAERGFSTTSLEDVADRIGVTKGVIYYYFRNKQDVYVELMTETLVGATERARAIAGRGREPRRVLRLILADHVRHLINQADRWIILLHIQNGDVSAESLERLKELRREYWEAIEDVIRRGIAAGIFVDRDPKLVARSAIYACSTLARWYDPGGPMTPRYVVSALVDQVMAGVMFSALGGEAADQ